MVNRKRKKLERCEDCGRLQSDAVGDRCRCLAGDPVFRVGQRVKLGLGYGFGGTRPIGWRGRVVEVRLTHDGTSWLYVVDDGGWLSANELESDGLPGRPEKAASGFALEREPARVDVAPRIDGEPVRRKQAVLFGRDGCAGQLGLWDH